jgi:mRNA interferase RelE/StbE
LRVSWSFQALEQLLALNSRDRRQARRIIAALQQWTETGRGDVKKLQGNKDRWRLRVGDWRLMYRRESDSSAIEITEILLRRDAYD